MIALKNIERIFRGWIIGKDNHIESWHDYRQIVLSAKYAVISLVILAIYTSMEILAGNPQLLLVYSLGFVLTLGSLFLHHYRKHRLAKYLLFHVLNSIVFLVGSSQSLATGAFIFLIPLALGTFVVFNYAQRRTALALCGLSFVLFGIALSGKISLLPYRKFSDDHFQINQLINFCIAFPASILAVYLLISMNHHNARKLECANKQLTKLNNELDRFVYSTSHDLRAPLLSVKGLLTISESATPSEQAGYRKMMHGRIESLDKFIKDITDYSRNNRLEILQESVHVAALVNDIWESLQYNPQAQGIEFKNDIPADLVIINDSRRMKVVLSNLISNAISYHDRRKENRFIRLYGRKTQRSFSLKVQDNGLGISPELHSKIFDMFFRGNESSQGSGLGLYIVKETLSKLSGHIVLESAPRQGSTFSVILPNQV